MNQDIAAVANGETPNPESWNYLKSRTAFLPRSAILDMVTGLSFQVPGNIIEFGVYDGSSTRVIRRVTSKYEKKFLSTAKKKIFACDSFEGLSEKYENADVGTFAVEPPRIPCVSIVKGYYEDSLTDELAEEVGTVSFAHLDADLFSSTLCVLTWLTPLLKTGSLLLFDEFIGGKESEKRAFEEWTHKTGIRTIKIGEFMRDPSGWGDTIDCRALFQVVGEAELPKISPTSSLNGYARRQLRKHPSFTRRRVE